MEPKLKPIFYARHLTDKWTVHPAIEAQGYTSMAQYLYDQK
jgi:hypothetical protein